MTKERKLISDRRRRSCVAAGGVEPAAQESDGDKESEVCNRFVIFARRLFSSERIVGADGERKGSGGQPGFHPPYQALTITATANTTRRLSAISEKNSAGINASIALRRATP